MVPTSPLRSDRRTPLVHEPAHQQSNNVQPNSSTIDNSDMFSLAMTRPAPAHSRCSLPPIRDLIELAHLGNAVPNHAIYAATPQQQPRDAIPRTMLPMFLDQTSRPPQQHATPSPTHQARPSASWSSHSLPPIGPPSHVYQVASGQHIDPTLPPMDPIHHRQSFASTTSTSSVRSGLSRTSYSASSPENSAIGMYPPGLPSFHPQDSGIALQRPLPTDFDPTIPSLRSDSTTSTVTSASPTGRDEVWHHRLQQEQQRLSPQALYPSRHAQQQHVPAENTLAQQSQRQHPHDHENSQPRTQASPYSVASASPQERYVCQTCYRGFSRPSSLQIHMNTHTGNRPFQCPIEGCGKRFSVRSNMRRHEKGRHPPPHGGPGCGGRRELQPRP